MPEESIETQELKERLEEAQEMAGRSPWLTWLSLSTAIVAVLAAIAALESGSYANDAIVQKDDAILHQSKAGDAWAYYQAKGVKAIVYATQAQAVTNQSLEAKLQAESDRETKERAEIKSQAQEEEKTVAEMNEKSEHSLHTHHVFAKGVTLFQVAIALSAIAALTRRKPLWWVGLGVGALGAAFFASGLVH
jgi:fumarylacetoacetate (FAA) hydrolase family protein